ncbi:MAG: CIA30 family protein [Ilumatobacter sp.]|uniref:CIA30 family protein n=1 Tax=Ilumatobacter sp. TaxID=1967498 RepID=UPI003C7713BB
MTTESDTTDAANPCRRLTDFDDEHQDRWAIVDDGVMGGRSSGAIGIADSIMRFSGTIVTDGGGFTSVRCRLDGAEMAGTTRMSMRVRADDRVYGVTLEDDAEVGERSVSHRADLDMTGDVDADGWTVTSIDYAQLSPSVFGRAVDAPPFDPDAAREIGIIIADGVDGGFSLDIDWVDVC